MILARVAVEKNTNNVTEEANSLTRTFMDLQKTRKLRSFHFGFFYIYLTNVRI